MINPVQTSIQTTGLGLQVSSPCITMECWRGVAYGLLYFLGRLSYSTTNTISAFSTYDTISVTNQIPCTIRNFSKLYL